MSDLAGSNPVSCFTVTNKEKEWLCGLFGGGVNPLGRGNIIIAICINRTSISMTSIRTLTNESIVAVSKSFIFLGKKSHNISSSWGESVDHFFITLNDFLTGIEHVSNQTNDITFEMTNAYFKASCNGKIHKCNITTSESISGQPNLSDNERVRLAIDPNAHKRISDYLGEQEESSMICLVLDKSVGVNGIETISSVNLRIYPELDDTNLILIATSTQLTVGSLVGRVEVRIKNSFLKYALCIPTKTFKENKLTLSMKHEGIGCIDLSLTDEKKYEIIIRCPAVCV
jgi:hypothetical protein